MRTLVNALARLLRLLIGLAIATAIALGLAGGAQTTMAAPETQSDRRAIYFAQCLQDWDPETHMTKQEWSRACQRVANERGNSEHLRPK
jgi:hypothetical protein